MQDVCRDDKRPGPVLGGSFEWGSDFKRLIGCGSGLVAIGLAIRHPGREAVLRVCLAREHAPCTSSTGACSGKSLS
jgi:hypothetical protein